MLAFTHRRPWLLCITASSTARCSWSWTGRSRCLGNDVVTRCSLPAGAGYKFTTAQARRHTCDCNNSILNYTRVSCNLQQRNQSHKNSMSHKTASRLQHVTSLESDLYIIASVTRYVETSTVKQWIVTLLSRKLWQPHFIQHRDPTVNKLLLNFITVFFHNF